MMLSKHSFVLGIFLVVLQSTYQSTPALALDNIIRPYLSTRSVGMGGVRITTGLYDENFFNNPARVTANPSSRLTLLQITPADLDAAAVTNSSGIIQGKDALKTITSPNSSNMHDRFQLILPAYYLASKENRKWAFAFGLISSAQLDASFRQSYQTNFEGIADIGPALTIGRKFLRNDALSVGVTGHLIYRVGTSPNYGLIDYVRGVPLTLNSIGGDGTMFDFDAGMTYKITQIQLFNISLGIAVQNALGGTYSNIKFHPLNKGTLPPSQPRSVGAGISATRGMWGLLRDTTFAIEATDIWNSPNASIYKLLHLGAETRFGLLTFRGGLNQGYWTAGLGINLLILNLDFATYGEELGLNAGSLEDRRYTFSLGIHI